MKNMMVEVRQLDYGFLMKTKATDTVGGQYPSSWEYESACESIKDTLERVASRFGDEELAAHIRKFERTVLVKE